MPSANSPVPAATPGGGAAGTSFRNRLANADYDESQAVLRVRIGTFEDGPGVVPEPIHAADCLPPVYLAADPAYTGRVTTPTLWDRQTGTILSNESAENPRAALTGSTGVSSMT